MSAIGGKADMPGVVKWLRATISRVGSENPRLVQQRKASPINGPGPGDSYQVAFPQISKPGRPFAVRLTGSLSILLTLAIVGWSILRFGL
jgi:hypothetical protein